MSTAVLLELADVLSCHSPAIGVDLLLVDGEDYATGEMYLGANYFATDDHLPLNRAGIRTIDIIDFDFGPGNVYWHTLADDLPHTSPRGLEAVGRVIETLIQRGG